MPSSGASPKRLTPRGGRAGRTAWPTLPRREVLDLVRALPEAIDVEELIYRLHLREKLARADADIAAGRTFTAAEVRRQAATWRK